MLTEQEKQYGDLFINYYSGRFKPEVVDKAKVDAFIYGTDEEKQLILKKFLNDVVLPQAQVDKNAVANNVTQIDNKIAEYQTYTKVTAEE